MSSRRVLKAAEAIREVVSMAILRDIKDPRVKNVTVTFVEVSGDLRHAKVHVSIMETEESKKQLCLKGLQSAAGYLQKKVGNRIETRYVPRLKFALDRGLEHSMVVTKILEDVLPAEEPVAAEQPGEAQVAEEYAGVGRIVENAVEESADDKGEQEVAEMDSPNYDSQSDSATESRDMESCESDVPDDRSTETG